MSTEQFHSEKNGMFHFQFVWRHTVLDLLFIKMENLEVYAFSINSKCLWVFINYSSGT
jgi:hypothetical protein